ncbi:hypothetical protein AVEN_46372-1 [Araneus ventricosus]|uniref:Uncharacterized protein n=1 Tax=Araneus ventricosus TaxID=182803 RepID=A0A4Y2JP16_ARAVE|nr:hypothetical protein AVEN_46372-1 [Araneus ventricosus]
MSWVWRFICYGTLSANPRRHDEESQGSNILMVQMGIQRGRQRPSSSTPIVYVHSGAMDLRQTLQYRSRTSASKKKPPQLKIYVPYILIAYTVKGSFRRKLLPIFPSPRLSKKKRLPKIF